MCFWALAAGRVHHQRGEPAPRRHRPGEGDFCVRADSQGRERPLQSAGERGALAGERGAQPDHAGESRARQKADQKAAQSSVL